MLAKKLEDFTFDDIQTMHESLINGKKIDGTKHEILDPHSIIDIDSDNEREYRIQSERISSPRKLKI